MQDLDTEDALRRYVKRLVRLGVKQATLADRLRTNATWVTRWLKKTGGAEMSVQQMDALYLYANDLGLLAAEIEAHRKRDFRRTVGTAGSPPDRALEQPTAKNRRAGSA